jgi:endogenous inhibitor of DNA gyrase (YacG/DUF329 family)
MTAARCPICAKPAEPKFSPFCSRRCADIDLSRWLKGGYAIPGRPVVDEDEAEGPSGPKSEQKLPPEGGE